jgi:hypothetical protein
MIVDTEIVLILLYLLVIRWLVNFVFVIHINNANDM